MPTGDRKDNLRDIYLFTGRKAADGKEELKLVPYEVYAGFEVKTPPAVHTVLAAGAVFAEVDKQQKAPARVEDRSFFVNLEALDPPGAPANAVAPRPGSAAKRGAKPAAPGAGKIALYVRRDDAAPATDTVFAVPWKEVDSCQDVKEPGARGRMLYFQNFGVVVANLIEGDPIGGLTCYLVNLSSLRSIGETRPKNGQKPAGNKK